MNISHLINKKLSTTQNRLCKDTGTIENHFWRVQRLNKIIFLLLLVIWYGLSKPAQVPAFSAESHVLCSVFPVYALTEELLASTAVRVDLLLPANLGCPHSYSLTPSDLQKITQANHLICLGLGFEPFLDRIRQGSSSSIFLSGEELSKLPAMLADKRHNPHLFTTPKGMQLLTNCIASHLVTIFPEHKKNIQTNATNLLAVLSAIENEWLNVRQHGGEGTPVVLLQDSLDYIAAALGLRVVARLGDSEISSSHDISLSAGKMIELIRTIREQRPVAILIDEQVHTPIAETLARETSVPLLAIDTLARGPYPVPAGYIATALRSTIERLKPFLPPASSTTGP